MKRIQLISTLSIAAIALISCNPNSNRADGYGNFEATEITISSESNGRIMRFDVKEGQQLTKDVLVGYIGHPPLRIEA